MSCFMAFAFAGRVSAGFNFAQILQKAPLINGLGPC